MAGPHNYRHSIPKPRPHVIFYTVRGSLKIFRQEFLAENSEIAIRQLVGNLGKQELGDCIVYEAKSDWFDNKLVGESLCDCGRPQCPRCSTMEEGR